MLNEEQKISEYFFGAAFSADRLFCDLTPETAKSLTAIKQISRFEKEKLVFTNGELPCCVYFLLEGKAQIFAGAALPGKNLARSVAPNEILGLTEAITNLPYETNLKTLTPCQFECIQRDDFIRFLQNESAVCFRLLQLLGSNLQKIYQIFSHQ